MTVAAARPPLLLVGLAGAMALRVALGAQQVSGAVPFAAVLLLLAAAAGVRRPRLSPRVLAAGLAGGGVLIAFPLLHPGLALSHPASALPVWLIVVSAVAIAEEILLRGALFAAMQGPAGTFPAIAVSSIAFALLHVPLYGWGAVPLDLAAGVWLGGLRVVSGSVAAPAAAHVLADVASWWLP